MVKRVGTYLPPAVREESLCGAEGKHLRYHELSTLRTRQKVTARLREAQTAGVICGLTCQDDMRQVMQGALDAPLFDGRLLCTSLRLTQLAKEADCSTRITLLGADSVLGQAAAVYLAKKVRFLSLVGRKTSLLDRLSKRLWQTEGIAVRVGRGEDDRILSMDEISSPSKWVSAEGRPLPPVVAECALIAGSAAVCDGRIITARTLEKMAEAAQFHGIELLAKKDTEIAEFD